MKDESTSSLAAVTLMATLLALLMLTGCQSSGARHKAVIETAVPNVWCDNPVQSLAFKVEITR